MRSERTPRARRYWAALVFVLCGTLAGGLHNRAVRQGRQDISSGVARTLLAPPAQGANGVSRWLARQTGWLVHGRGMDADNRRLRAQVEELQGQVAQLAELQTENERLRADLKFVQTQKTAPLAAEVLARRPSRDYDTIIIGRGSRGGVHVGSIVRTRNGLVGKVSEVSPTTAVVILLTDPNGGVGGRVQRNGARSATGVCKGDYSTQLTMLDMAGDADIRAGDLVVTSGFYTLVPGQAKGTNTVLQTYPKGIPIGTVVSVRSDEGSISKTAVLQPVVDFDRLEEVYVLP